MNFTWRNVDQQDLPFLWKMLYQSMYVPEGQAPFPKEIVNEPYIKKYLDQWGKVGDMGLVAEKNNKPIGAIWLRLFDETNKGFGYVDDTTPELGIAILEEERGQGIGSVLMKEIENHAKDFGYKKISLSVDPANPARQLYESLGYRHVGWCETSWTMVKDLI